MPRIINLDNMPRIMNLDNMLELFFKGIAIGGIYIVWSDFTAKAFNSAFQILFPSSEEEEEEETCKPVACEKCRVEPPPPVEPKKKRK